MNNISKYNRGWKENQAQEQKRLREQEWALADDELPRGGNPWGTSIALILVLCIAAILGMGLKALSDRGAGIHEAGKPPIVASAPER